MPNAPYRIYAVRYAHRACKTSEAFYGDYHTGPITMDYFVWRSPTEPRRWWWTSASPRR